MAAIAMRRKANTATTVEMAMMIVCWSPEVNVDTSSGGHTGFSIT